MTKRIKTSPVTPPPIVPERFEFWSTGAREVCIAGSFNEWHPAATPMIDLGAGHWAKELTLPPGRHEYLFVVDGVWMPDAEAETAVPNPFGGWNSVREVGAGSLPDGGVLEATGAGL